MQQPTDKEHSPLYSLPCDVVVPTSLMRQIFGKGMAAGVEDEQRSFVRVNCDTDRIRVGVNCMNELPALDRENEWRSGILVDVSKSGFQLLYHEELFPGEKFRIAFEKEGGLSTVDARVARCRRLAPTCYAVGLERLVK